MTPDESILWPPPQRVEIGREVSASSDPAVRVGPCGLPSQGYRLTLGGDAITIDATDEAGLRYARRTLEQLRAQHGGATPTGLVEDWPAVATRGVMLDVSRARVPTLATLEALIERLAAWKINHLELYIEHTFAYAGHNEVWAEASPYSADDLRALDDYAAVRGVELSANQNCLGHMERWLRHARYRPLALSPDGFTAPWGVVMPPMTMDPTNPASVALARDLLGQLLPVVRSRRAHVGLDEPWELPSTRASEWLDYLRALRSAPETAEHELLAWADMPARYPQLAHDVPDGVTLCEWGYEADHPFDERAAALSSSGTPFWLCPGTSSWNSIGGRWTNAVDNIRAASAAASAHGATGVMVTDWGDNGHLQHLVVSEPLLAWAAGCAWNSAACDASELPSVVDAWGVGDATGGFGKGMRAIGDAHRRVEVQLVNQSILTAHLYRPSVRLGASRRTTGITDDGLAAAGGELERARQLIERSAPARDDASLVKREACAAADLLTLLVDDARARVAGDGSLDSVPPATRNEFAGRLRAITAEHRALWLEHNRAGGLAESVAVLDTLAGAYDESRVAEI